MLLLQKVRLHLLPLRVLVGQVLHNLLSHPQRRQEPKSSP